MKLIQTFWEHHPLTPLALFGALRFTYYLVFDALMSCCFVLFLYFDISVCWKHLHLVDLFQLISVCHLIDICFLVVGESDDVTSV